MLPAGRDQQPFGARGEQPLGAGVVLLRPVVGDPQDQPGPARAAASWAPRITSAK